jgi:hypothetical protein
MLVYVSGTTTIYCKCAMGYHHIAEVNTVNQLKAVGTPSIIISRTEHDRWVAQSGALDTALKLINDNISVISQHYVPEPEPEAPTS